MSANNTQVENILKDIEALSSTDSAIIAEHVLKNMDSEEANKLLKNRQVSLLKIPLPEQPGKSTNDYLWKVIIWGVIIVLVGSALGLSIGVFILKTDTGTALQPVVTVFTAAMAFIGGSQANPPKQNGQSNAQPDQPHS